MRYGSVCSGIEAASVAWSPLGWKPVFFSEVAPFPSKVLRHHYPEVPNLGDFTQIGSPPIDLLVGGTPCQSFSMAGLRAGLSDARGNLALEFMRLVARIQPRWVLWENVPGVLSTDGGRAFGSILGALAELGYGWAYRVLDAQHFGVPQRRRRVFVVGHLGDWRRPAQVLFEPESVHGNPQKVRRPRHQDSAATEEGAGEASREPLAFHPTQDPISGPVSPALSCTAAGMGVVVPYTDPVAQTLNASDAKGAGAYVWNGAVRSVQIVEGVARRMTPLECERLQGFPDGYTDLGPDTPRYKALGNSMAVPVMSWLGSRIQKIDSRAQLTNEVTQ